MRSEFHTRCDAIEESYEFMLAYAAQGVSGDAGSQTGGQLREYLRRAVTALNGLGDLLLSVIESESLQPAAPYHAYHAILDRDACAAVAAIELVLAQPSISSQLVDNLNASTHVRALLTDLFLVDEILNPNVISSTEPRGSVPPAAGRST